MISDTELQRIAILSRIQIAPEEQVTLKKDLSSILDYITKLNEVDTDGVEPLYQTSGLLNSDREDEARGEFVKTPERDELLIGAFPEQEKNMAKVPSILKK